MGKNSEKSLLSGGKLLSPLLHVMYNKCALEHYLSQDLDQVSCRKNHITKNKNGGKLLLMLFFAIFLIARKIVKLTPSFQAIECLLYITKVCVDKKPQLAFY